MENEVQHPELEVFDIHEQFLMYQGLVYLIKHGKGEGFMHSDKQHPRYTQKYVTGESKSYPFHSGFDPHHDTLYRALYKLSANIKNFDGDNINWFHRIESWDDFQGLIKNSIAD